MKSFIRLCVVVCSGLILAACGSRELLSSVSVTPATISPNADGAADATQIHYELSRKANVSITFTGNDGQAHYFRQNQTRAAGVYDVLFGGVIDGKLLPDGTYTWTIDADSTVAQGQLTIDGGEKTAPQITMLTVFPKEFTPNRDGISDRARINVVLNKPATLFTSLQNSLCNGSETPPPDQPTLDCAAFPLSETEGAARKPGEAGLHLFDYDAGVDLGAEPPPDGTYVVTARAEDNVGQVTVATDTLKIVDGGVPRAEIVDGTVQYSKSAVLVGDTLYFTLTVENYGAVPIRTSGPLSGYVYQDIDDTYNAAGYATESGVWRVGIDFETSKRNYPFRWAVGGADDLVVKEIEGVKYYYLPAGKRATITGGIHITAAQPRRDVVFWAGLIHEDVEITSINNNVDPQPITIEQP